MNECFAQNGIQCEFAMQSSCNWYLISMSSRNKCISFTPTIAFWWFFAGIFPSDSRDDRYSMFYCNQITSSFFHLFFPSHFTWQCVARGNRRMWRPFLSETRLAVHTTQSARSAYRTRYRIALANLIFMRHIKSSSGGDGDEREKKHKTNKANEMKCLTMTLKTKRAKNETKNEMRDTDTP